MGNPGNQSDKVRDGNPDDNGHKPPFDPRTYLYIRRHPLDNGIVPLPAGLETWMSPDILVTPQGGMPGDIAAPGVTNQVSVTVTNAGGIDAVDAYVDVFLADPSTTITPSTATLIGAGFLTIPGYNTATISVNWTPGSGDSGHRCLLARVSLPNTGDTYANPAIFDVVGDRHVAQRNIHVVELAGRKSMTFGFVVVNPLPDAADFQLQLEELKPDPATIAQVRRSLGCGFAQFDAQPLRVIALGLGDTLKEDLVMTRTEPSHPVIGVLDQQVEAAAIQRQLRTRGQLNLKQGERRYATIRIEGNDRGRAGDLHVVQLIQRYAKTGALIGGLTLIVRN